MFLREREKPFDIANEALCVEETDKLLPTWNKLNPSP